MKDIFHPRPIRAKKKGLWVFRGRRARSPTWNVGKIVREVSAAAPGTASGHQGPLLIKKQRWGCAVATVVFLKG